MSQCCTSSDTKNSYPRKHRCPVNGEPYSSVSTTTILHHIEKPWRWYEKQQGYYFCGDPECNVVYFGQDDTVILKSELRTIVGIKEQHENALLCYCFGVSKQLASNQHIKDFVVKSTKEQACACSTRNPSGKCCLSDFPKP